MSTESIAATLRITRELIADRSRWTQHAFGRDENGIPNWDKAVTFCVLGALMKVDGPHEKQAHEFLQKATSKLFRGGPIYVNDHMGHEAILQCLDEAIAEAERS